jgi:protease-4
MHREIEKLARKKPVVACFGDVAASGGYYLACGCQRIVAQPLCITGSIGVVSMKVAAPDLLQTIGVRPQLLRTAPSADMLAFSRTLTAAEQALLMEHANELYDRFLAVVAGGRGKSVAEIEPLARGRVWNGRDAHERGLVDVLGGIERAVEEARSLLPDMPESERAALLPRVYHPKGPGRAAPDAAAALLGSVLQWLPDLALLELSRKERALYYAVSASGLE